MTISKSSYARVNGLNMYYEIHGEGQPLAQLHGALSAIGISFGTILPDLARERQVIAVEMQGHGHTADIDRPLRYEQLPDDTAALLTRMEIEPEHAVELFRLLGGGVAGNLAGLPRSQLAVLPVSWKSSCVDTKWVLSHDAPSRSPGLHTLAGDKDHPAQPVPIAETGWSGCCGSNTACAVGVLLRNSSKRGVWLKIS